MRHFYPKFRPSLVAVIILILGFAFAANARITKITISSVQSPNFGGTTFGSVGTYEKLVGTAYGEVDPNDRHNSMIADISLAPRNSNGMVEYSMDIYILRPVDGSKGNGKLFYEINNRGAKLALSGTFGSINSASSGGNDPTTAADAGDGFLMREGYTIVWSGWDISVAPGASRLTITTPVAKNRDGSTIVGPAIEELNVDGAGVVSMPLTYSAASLVTSQATLTVRNHYSDTPTVIPSSAWSYISPTSIQLLPAKTQFQVGTLYELTYQAQNPVIAGLGFAATRDFASFLHWASTDDNGSPNPTAGTIRHVYTFGVSQPTRFLHDFLYLGFNEDEQGRRVADAMENYTGGGNGGFFNYRFAQPGRTHRQHINRWYPELEFPFTNQYVRDPITGREDSRLRRCEATNTCPKILEINSENEYWAKSGSLLHTDLRGNDLNLEEAPNTRVYLLSNIAHVPTTGVGICQQPRNPIVPDPALRALLVALDKWVTHDSRPPENRIPRVYDGTLVSSSQHSVGFPQIPGVIYNGLTHTADLLGFGPSFDLGILLTLPPIVQSAVFPTLVPRTDADGIDVAGVHLPDIAVPLATYTGWGLRSGPAANDGCDAYGQEIPFLATASDRISQGDPRFSIEERYKTHQNYVREVRLAVDRLLRERFLLEEDGNQFVQTAESSTVLNP